MKGVRNCMRSLFAAVMVGGAIAPDDAGAEDGKEPRLSLLQHQNINVMDFFGHCTIKIVPHPVTKSLGDLNIFLGEFKNWVVANDFYDSDAFQYLRGHEQEKRFHNAYFLMQNLDANYTPGTKEGEAFLKSDPSEALRIAYEYSLFALNLKSALDLDSQIAPRTQLQLEFEKKFASRMQDYYTTIDPSFDGTIRWACSLPAAAP